MTANREPRTANREPRTANREPRTAKDARSGFAADSAPEPGTAFSPFPRLRVPVGPDAGRWRTLPGRRTLVAVARTVTSTVRVLDVLRPVLRDDDRVDLLFAYDATSAFSAGVRELLDSLGIRTLPWEQFRALSPAPDLIVTATENAGLVDPSGACTTPVLALLHGVGFHKQVPDARGPGERLAGMVPEALLPRTLLALSHPGQADQLREFCPATAGRTVLVGDPCHDMLVAGQDLRDRYRRALGIRDGRRLVVISSTWRDRSVLGQDTTLPARLLAQLPLDEYAVALVTHPNIPAAHGSYQLDTVLASALDAGLLRIPAEQGWQAVLCAADVVVGDHGSVTFYGAALGTPLLLGAFADDEVVAGTPMAELGRIAPRLDPAAPLLPQIERAVAEHDPALFRKVGASALIAPGRALQRLRALVYDALMLPAPQRRIPLLAPADPVPYPWPAQTAVHLTTHADLAAGRVTVRRHPAAVADFAPLSNASNGNNGNNGEPCVSAGARDTGFGDRIDTWGADFSSLHCDDEELDLGLRQRAASLSSRDPARALARHPRARLAVGPVADGRCRILLDDGRALDASLSGRPADPALLCAVVHALLDAGAPLAGRFVLAVGPREEEVVLRAAAV
ncbi:CDP-glycerol glycerophosphotransferase family protein [Streptomyces sp. NPDC058657]|uniref:CDP-glycerol glycerophosphotransferase family protein n=1 Tax=unclassified Streptomyces TaxID=2593676 RepID=UPI003649CFF4